MGGWMSGWIDEMDVWMVRWIAGGVCVWEE